MRGFSRSSRRGQAAVFVLALLGIVLLSTMLLYKSGRVTSEKMQLQNAADSAAYSVAVLEARAYNFAAYTNRAMVANEIAVGQLIGLMSWADQLESAGFYSDLYGTSLQALPVIGNAVGGALIGVGEAFDSGGKVIKKVLSPIFNVAVKILYYVNKAYSFSQSSYHLATIEQVLAIVLNAAPHDNVQGTPKRNLIEHGKLILDKSSMEGAALSNFGALTTAYHALSYIDGHTRSYSPGFEAKQKKKKEKKEEKKKKKKEKNEKKGKKDKEKKGIGKIIDVGKDVKGKISDYKKNTANNQGLNRLAATIREGRDQFTQSRDWNLTAGFPKKRPLEFSESANFAIGEVGFDLKLIMSIGFDGLGGSELRYHEKPSNYSWSAADTMEFEGQAGCDIGGWLKVLGSPKVGISLGKLLKYFGLPELYIDLGIPFGAGFYQASQTSKNNAMTAIDMGLPLPGKAPHGAYGGAQGQYLNLLDGHFTSWGLPPGGPLYKTSTNNLDAYGGLPAYRDVNLGYSQGMFKAPFFVVGYVSRIGELDEKGPQTAGTLELKSGSNENFMGAVAKSEVYFSRPGDVKWFARKDGNTEKGNLFSPFWQARLVELDDSEKFLALYIQHGVLWVDKKLADNIPGAQTIKGLMDFLTGWLNH